MQGTRRLALLLTFVLLSFSANSLITRHVVNEDLLDAGLLSGVRILAGAVALATVTLARGERISISRRNAVPTLALGAYAICISYGYRFIGAAAGTFVFYALVMLTLIGSDVVSRTPIPPRRRAGIAVALLGLLVLTVGKVTDVTVLGVVLLALTGVSWGIYTFAGRTSGEPRAATTGNFVLLAAVSTPPTVVGFAAGLHVTASGLAWGVVMGAGTTAFAYVAWYACQPSLTGSAAGTTQLSIPVITAVGAVLLLGESFGWTLLVAALLVGAGLWLNRVAPPTKVPAQA